QSYEYLYPTSTHFFLTDLPPTRSSPLSLHDALPISRVGRSSPAGRDGRRRVGGGGVEPGVGERSQGLGEGDDLAEALGPFPHARDRKSTRLNSSHVANSYAGFCLKKKKNKTKKK